MTNFQDCDLVRFTLRLEPSTLASEKSKQCKLAAVESTTQFGFGNVRHRHERDQILADAKRYFTKHIAKARPRIETRRADPAARS